MTSLMNDCQQSVFYLRIPLMVQGPWAEPIITNMSVIKVKNVSDTEYAGIKPGEIGEIDVNRWGPYQFALKKMIEKPKEEEPKVQPKREPKKQKTDNRRKYKKGCAKKSKNYNKEVMDRVILLQAFVYAAGGVARASLLLGVRRKSVNDWLSLYRNPSRDDAKELLTLESLSEYLNESEQGIFKQKVIELCQEKLQNKKSK